MSSELQVPQTPQADVEGSDDGHSHIQDDWKLPGILHFVFKGQNLWNSEKEEKTQKRILMAKNNNFIFSENSSSSLEFLKSTSTLR